jgi:hypothetical protein
MASHRNNTLSQQLKDRIQTAAATWAADNSLPHYNSHGSPGVVMFQPHAKGHGNFEAQSWTAIQSNPDWQTRLTKPHPQRRALPEPQAATAAELDSSNSSDALLMNVFCHSGMDALLNGLKLPQQTVGSVLEFGFLARVQKRLGLDRTEVDLRFGALLLEAKLTETDFTAKPKAQVDDYSAFHTTFHAAHLPQDATHYLTYQLIRNVLAAQQHGTDFVTLIDASRTDLATAWSDTVNAVLCSRLRSRCHLRTWQEVRAAADPVLATFLKHKYGI